MTKGETVYCIDESTYSDHISKRKGYLIIDSKEGQIRIKNNNQKLVWIPNICFVDYEIPQIISINIDDEIRDENDSCIEVTINFSDSKKGFVIFMTINWLKNLFSVHQNYIIGTHLILVQEVNENIISETIKQLDKKNELTEMTTFY